MNKSFLPSSITRLLPYVGLAVVAMAMLYPFLLVKDEDDPSRLGKRQQDIPDFSAYTDVVEKKQAFFNYLLPEVQRQNQQILEQRTWLMALSAQVQQNESLSKREIKKLDELAETYKLEVESWDQASLQRLLRRVDVIPEALVLVQAANESAWGTSRFAQQGYNFFGLWCFRRGCGFVPKRRDDDAEHEVAKFRNLTHAVRTYLTNLNRHPAYREMRSIRETLRANQQPVTAEAMAEGLLSYSERGQAYIEELHQMIRVNRRHMQI